MDFPNAFAVFGGEAQGLMITLTSKDNAQIKNAARLLKSARYRKQTGLFVAEGLRVCEDAARSGASIETLFVTQAALDKNPDVCERLCARAGKAFLLSPSLFASVSDTQNPQGVAAVIKTLDKSALFDTINNGGKFLALENIQDPNNLGTILRSAEAFGVSGVVLSRDCCDPFNPKVVRGSMGAVFRVPMLTVDSLAGWFAGNPSLNTFAAVPDSGAEPVTEIEFTEPCAVVIGNEGNGIRQETAECCRRKITIPMNGKAESLNASVAAAILIWEMVK